MGDVLRTDVERVARAIAEVATGGIRWVDLTDGQQAEFFEQAEAAIEATR